MNQPRTHVISRRSISSAGLKVNSDVWLERYRQFKLQLHSDIPSLESLEASELRLDFDQTDRQTYLVAELVERSQGMLINTKSRVPIFDGFANDVARVLADQKSINLRILLAQSPATDPFQNPSVVRTRQRLSEARRRRELTIWSDVVAKQIMLFEPPRFIPNSQQAMCNVKVLNIFPTRAQIELLEDVHFGDQGSRSISVGTKLNLTRVNGHDSVASGAILQSAMDQPCDCKICFSIVLRWDSGQVSHLELLHF